MIPQPDFRLGRYPIAVTAALVFSALPAYADLMIDVSDAFIDAGGPGTVDVFISSTGSDAIEFASYEFAITPVGTPGSSLEFSYPPDFSEDSIGGPNGYLFFGDSFGLDYDGVNSTASTYIGFDSVDMGPNVTLGATERLLVRLDLQHTLGGGQSAAMADGEQFRITLQNSFDTFFDFADIDGSSFLPATGGGLITVQNAAAVPEPGSLAFLSIATAGTWCYRRRRKTSNRSRQTVGSL